MYNVCIGLSRRRRADPSVISFISLLSWETSITVDNNNDKKKTVLKTKHKKFNLWRWVLYSQTHKKCHENENKKVK